MMKLKKIKKIKRYKSFEEFNWQCFFNNQNFHDKVNILYGENGSGKSSVINLLKSVSGNKGFDQYQPAEVCLAFDDGDKNYTKENNWDSKIDKGKLMFFDREFVDKNVHLGHQRDTTQDGQEQESGKMIIELDSKAIDLRKVREEAEDKKEAQRKINKNFEDENRDCLNFYLNDLEKEFYDCHKDKSEKEIEAVKQELEEKERKQEKDLESDRDRQEKVSNIQNEIETLSIKEFNSSLSELKILLDEMGQIKQAVSDFNLDKLFIKLEKLNQTYKIQNIYSVEEKEKHRKPVVKAIEELGIKIELLKGPNKENIAELYNKAEDEFEAINFFFKDIAEFVDQKNKLITQFKQDNTDEELKTRIDLSEKEIIKIENELAFINQGKLKKQKDKEEKKQSQKHREDELDQRNEEYKKASTEYEEYCSTKAFSNLLSKIQDYFNKFNFSFKLELKTAPTGNKKEFPFAFKVLDSEDQERDFKEGLSEGEIQVLSLCFFFAFLDLQKDKQEKILFFDDPITSLDNSNLSSLVDLIAAEQENFSQIFVFTHHRTFFKFLGKRLGQEKNCNEYNLIRNQKEWGGSFMGQSKSSNFKEKLRGFESKLRSFSQEEGVDVELKIIEYGQYLRYAVERYIKNDLLYWNEDKFKNCLEGIKKNKKIDDGDLDKIKGIYSFCNWTTSHVDVGDDHGLDSLKEKIKCFLKIKNKYK